MNYLKYKELLKAYCQQLLDAGYRGFEYGIHNTTPITSQRQLCSVEGVVSHYDFIAEDKKSKQKMLSMGLFMIGFGIRYKDGVEGWFFRAK